VAAVRADDEALGGGRFAAIVPRALRRAVAAAVRSRLAASEPASSDLAERLDVLIVNEAKGLEFDSVVLLDPARIVAESARGVNDLYVRSPARPSA